MEGTITALIFIDNYEEVIESMEQARQSLLFALIDRKVNALAQEVNGIIKKFEKDKYIFMLSESKLELLIEKKFEILSYIRELEMGNQIPVTLSIGIGKTTENLSKSMEYARVAIDLALGRGGDQAVIKDAEKFYFFGGKLKEVGSNARVRARVKAYAISELIEEASNVIIMGHIKPDLDCFGSAIGMYKVASAMDKPCNIILNEVTTPIKEMYDRIIKISEYENVFIKNNEAIALANKKTLVIIVDTHRQSLFECGDIIDKTRQIVILDHHRKSTDFVDKAVLTYHEPYASSASELVTEILQYVKSSIKLKAAEADALLAGITIDTKFFAFKTGARTFEAAAYLKRNGADTLKVRMLFRNDYEHFKTKLHVIDRAEINDDIAISCCEKNKNAGLIAAQSADELLNIKGIEASFVIAKEEKRIVISARSIGNINVQVIMEKMGGGGHQTVSAVQLLNDTIESARKKLDEALKSYFEEEDK